MKKFLLMAVLLVAAGSFSAQAQMGTDTVNMQAAMARMKERQKPQLVEKVKLTEAQADKVVEINFESQLQRRGLREMAPEDRRKKMEELSAERNKKLAAIPLTPEQVKAVNDFYEELRRNAPQRGNAQQ